MARQEPGDGATSAGRHAPRKPARRQALLISPLACTASRPGGGGGDLGFAPRRGRLDLATALAGLALIVQGQNSAALEDWARHRRRAQPVALLAQINPFGAA
jgi:hypothetical protein